MQTIKKRLIVDMDGVLADVYSQFQRLEELATGKRVQWKDLIGIPEEKAFCLAKQHVHSKGFFSTAPLIEGAVEALQELSINYEVFIVSAAMEFPDSLTEKRAWLTEHFSFINWQQIVFCGSKNVIQGDIMIDDHFKNLDYFKGQTILFSQPHNIGKDDHQHTRVDSWKEIIDLLL